MKDRMEKFSFKDRKWHSTKFLQEWSPSKKAKSKKEKNQLQGTQKLKFGKRKLEFVNMINTIRSNYDHLLAPPFNVKREDPGLPMITCKISQQTFYNAFSAIQKVMHEYQSTIESFT
jgi:hypothetical protein